MAIHPQANSYHAHNFDDLAYGALNNALNKISFQNIYEVHGRGLSPRPNPSWSISVQ